ncbi:hypothetical protein Caci_5314 [Catenulispora acidiphila DSM 44928]|uniref:Uncharacterized protein n=1 Tax=Catenulispora acidiphila (strain DSM 44928 / JCM 14897 / NBRC 102108 / NRRL B-24433 / ID139908) TaxID=479433 RepID=C7Q806_CATAD|nr:hypothetical protein [Catenulispora acidiphila]ACU74173.1 hypothetical protein Caci_5314 [Catenulispora acidiphila DSM 44928]
MKAAGRAADDAGSAGDEDADLQAARAQGGEEQSGEPDPGETETRSGEAGRLRRASDILGEVLFGGGAGRAKSAETRQPPEADPAPSVSHYAAAASTAASPSASASASSSSSAAKAPVPSAAPRPRPAVTPTWSDPAPGDEATRYLCAATHLDAAFTRRALKEFVFDEGRAPAPTTGVDEVLVLRHALAARTRRLHRDVALVALTVVALLVSVWTVAAWLVWGAGLWLLVTGSGSGRGAQGANSGGADDWAVAGPRDGLRPPPTSPAHGQQPSASFAPLARFVALVWGVAGAGAIAAAAGLAHPFGLGVPDRFHDAGPGSPWMAWLFVPLAGVLTAWLIVLAERLAARHVLVDKLRRDRFGTHRWITTETVWARRALAELAARVASDRQVLADPARPFAGAGRQVLRRRWLLETGPIRLDVEDLIERVTDALAAGVPGLGPEGLLDKVAWDDFVVATGPVLAVGQTTDASLRLLPSPRNAAAPRVFRRFRILADPAETVVTVYLSASAAPGLALIEIHGLVLEPVAAAYRGVDRLPGLGVPAALVEGWHAAATVPRLLFAAPRSAASAAADPWRWRHRRAVLDRAAAGGLPAADGARTSLRELGVAAGSGARGPLVDREGSPFAREDANLALAVVERRVREALRPLL